MFKIEINNWQKKIKLEKNKVKTQLAKILRLENVQAGEINLVFTDDAQIKKLNQKYLKRHFPTDVLAFPFSQRKTKQGFAINADVAISLETCQRNSRRFGTSFFDELTLYLTHAILHLKDYSDESACGKKRMEKRQAQILKKLK
jgi:probable rRNA maturation factor